MQVGSGRAMTHISSLPLNQAFNQLAGTPADTYVCSPQPRQDTASPRADQSTGKCRG